MLKIRHLFCLTGFVCASCSTAPGPVVPKNTIERQMIGLLEKFDRWDENGDGELDHSELAVGLKGTDFKPDRVIDFYDTNGNRRISLREAQAGYQRANEANTIVEARRIKERASQ